VHRVVLLAAGRHNQEIVTELYISIKAAAPARESQDPRHLWCRWRGSPRRVG
jgi:hypothetical protein